MENDFEIQRYEKVPLNFIFKSMKLVGLKMKKTFKISHKRCKYGKNQCHLFCSRVTVTPVTMWFREFFFSIWAELKYHKKRLYDDVTTT